MEKRSRNSANSVAAAKKRKLETEEEARRRKNVEKHQKAVKRANTIPDSQCSARNAHQIFIGKQIVPELNESADKLGDMNSKCKFCSAKKWEKETASLCCNSGKVVLDNFPDPPPLLKNLLIKDTEEAKIFRKNTRPLNNALTLSSLQVHVRTFDSGFAPNVIFEGKVCQRIGPLFPAPSLPPRSPPLDPTLV